MANLSTVSSKGGHVTVGDTCYSEAHIGITVGPYQVSFTPTAARLLAKVLEARADMADLDARVREHNQKERP